MADIIEITSAALSAGIDPLGAELHYLRDAAGRDLLWDGDPAYWTGRAPILFPVIGVLRNESYRLGNRRYAMPKHGFARRRDFAVESHDVASVTFVLAADEETRALYPFDFRLALRFALSDSALAMTATVGNQGDSPMPASFGFHPALRWPLPYGQPREDHHLLFASPEPAPIRRIDADGLLVPTLHPTPIDGDKLPLRDDLFIEDAVILDRVASRSLDYGASTGPRLAVAYPDMPMLGLWTKPGAGYICIEPWQGIADPEGFDGDLFAKPGIVVVPPKTERHFTMHIELKSSD